MADLTLSVDGSRTVDATNLRELNSALDALTQAHESGDDVAVRSGSLRWRDGGVWIQVNLTLPTVPADIDADKDTLAQVAANTGLFDNKQAAKNGIDVF